MIKKIICTCLAVFMVFSVSMVFSGCTKEKNPDKNDLPAESEIEATDNIEYDTKNGAEQNDTKQSIKDSMNDALDKSDADLTEEERNAINDLFDMFAE